MFRPLEPLSPGLAQQLEQLRLQLAAWPAALVAYSGGGDSTLVAAIEIGRAHV